MTPRQTPPRWADSLLRLAVPRGTVGQSIVGDLRVEYLELAAREGLRAARWWYRREAIALAARYLWHRLGAAAGPGLGHGRRLKMGTVGRDVALDIRFALRTFGRHPTTATLAVVTLSLSIGANAAIVSVVDGVLVRALPYDDPDSIVRVWFVDERSGDRFLPATFEELERIRGQARSFSTVAAFSLAPRDFQDATGDPERVIVARLSGDLFGVLGVAPALGRGFVAADTRDDVRVALLSHGLWQRRYGGDSSVVGRQVTVRGEATLVVGIMGPTFEYPKRAELWRPFRVSESQDDDRELQILARLRPEVTRAQAGTEVEGIVRDASANGANDLSGGAWVQPMRDMLVRNVRTPLLLLLGAVTLVLVIAVANIANLLIASAIGREREFAIRVAIGAGRTRLIRQLLTEGIVLALAGGAGGVVLARWGLDAIVALSPDETPRLLDVAVDARIIAVMTVVTAAVGLAAAGVPAWHASRARSVGALGSARGATGGTRKHRVQRALVTTEIGLSTMLAIGAALFIVSFERQLHLDRGFTTERTLVVPIDPLEDFASASEIDTYFHELQSRIRALPGVTMVTMASTSPMNPLGFRVRVRSSRPGGVSAEPALTKIVSDGFFQDMGIRIVSGRGFTRADDRNTAPVAVVNEAFRTLFLPPGNAAIGTTINTSAFSAQVVGVTRNLAAEPGAGPRATIFLPFRQTATGGMHYLVRSEGDPAGLVPAIRDLVRQTDKTISLNGIVTLETEIANTVAAPRFNMILIAAFATLALVLAVVGVYGVTSHAVTQRTRELGVRQALGARRPAIMRMVVGQGMRLAFTGIAAGGLGALWLADLVGTLLYGVSPNDPRIYVVVGVALAATTAIACYLPARRATRIDPIGALRG